MVAREDAKTAVRPRNNAALNGKGSATVKVKAVVARTRNSELSSAYAVTLTTAAEAYTDLCKT